MSFSEGREVSERQSHMLQLLAMLGGLDLEAPEAAATSAQVRKPGSSDSPYVMVAAIDFGTTFSGYAFSFKKDKRHPNSIKMNKNWGSDVGFQSYKTPTCVLLDANNEFESFGFEAQHKYADLLDDEVKNYHFFERFKMKLHETKDLSKSAEVFASDGSCMPALVIFSMALAYMKKHIMDAVNNGTQSNVEKNLIRWVITVPAIWSDASKQFMREAALKAGLIDKLDSQHLVIALEPEAASLFVRKLEINQFVTPGRGDKQDYKIKAGAKYLVIDAGGGTLDVTAHELEDDGRVKELHYATGGALGGTRVDGEFVKLMEVVFGKTFIRDFTKESSVTWLNMMIEFERIKRRPISDIRLNIPYNFATSLQEKTGKTIHQVLQETEDQYIKFSNGMVCIAESKTKELFKPVVNDIVAHIAELLKHPKLQGIEYFFCVGGFSECVYLQDAIKSEFSKDITILIPEEASLSVMKGAVQFGHDPDSISSRISAKTYGVETMTTFIPFIHSRSKAVSVEGKLYCKDVFESYVKKGCEVPMGFTKMSNFTPVKTDQQGADIEIYSANKVDVSYITEDGVDHHGKINVNWPGSGLDRKLEVCMIFGGTEVQVEATSHPGGTKVETKIDFLTD